MANEVVCMLVYLLTILIPINGLIFLGMRNEARKNRSRLMAMWKMVGRIPK